MRNYRSFFLNGWLRRCSCFARCVCRRNLAKSTTSTVRQRTAGAHSGYETFLRMQEPSCPRALMEDLFTNSAVPVSAMSTARRFAVRLVGGRPEMTHGAAGSAIKGISVVPVNTPASAESTASAKTRVSPGVEKHPAAGRRTHRPSIAASVFTISRDQRLTRWDLVEENKSDTCTPFTGADGPHSPDSRIRGDGTERSSSSVVGSLGDQCRQCSHAGGTASDAGLSHVGSDGLRQGTRQGENEERLRWRLRWRAGCVTDVADVSGLDVYPLPGNVAQSASVNEDTTSEEHGGRTATEAAHASPAALVAVSGQGLQLVVFGAY